MLRECYNVSIVHDLSRCKRDFVLSQEPALDTQGERIRVILTGILGSRKSALLTRYLSKSTVPGSLLKFGAQIEGAEVVAD
jgi:hypothetical protein